MMGSTRAAVLVIALSLVVVLAIEPLSAPRVAMGESESIGTTASEVGRNNPPPMNGAPAGNSEGPLECRQIWSAVGDAQNGSEYGSVAKGVGDVNGDGFDDFLVAAPFYTTASNYSAGKAYLYLGGSSGPRLDPSWTSVGDDSFVAYFGASIASGDLNLDGFGDVVVGAPGFLQPDGWTQGHAGKIYVFHGSPGGLEAAPAQTILGDRAFENYFGLNLAVVGDVDGNGYPDLVVSHGRYPDVSRVYLFLNGPSGFQGTPAWVFPADSTWDAILGESIRGADVNGDGYPDLVVADPFYYLYPGNNVLDHHGRVYLFLGGPGGWRSEPDQTWTGDQFRGLFGRYTASGGDVNGDGFDDIAVGELGAVRLFQGGADRVTADPVWVTRGTGNWSDFVGWGVALDGDLNADGASDLLVGEAGYDLPDAVDAGRLYVYLGGSGGLKDTPDLVLYGEPERYAHFGWSVSYAGNVDGRPGDEFLVGHRSFWIQAQTPGKAYLYTCGAEAPSSPVRFDFDPDTLNLNSKGRWVTAYIEVEDASAGAIARGSLTLNGIPVAWSRLVDDTLMAKFDRSAFAASVAPGADVVVTLVGRWEDGGTFTATAMIRVIRTGR